MQLRNRELEAIYAVDHIRDEDHSLDDFLDITVAKISPILQCEMSYVMLYDSTLDKLKLQSVSSDELWDEKIQKVVERFGQESLDKV